MRLAVDDFGTGYSSLSYLQRFPIDILKIDRSFVSTVDDEATTRPLAPAIMSLASTLRLQAVAEGVETGVQADILTALGCQHGQGYFFSRPVAPGCGRGAPRPGPARGAAPDPAPERRGRAVVPSTAP